ncbi:DUF2281 domain-containing protein [Myxosarcina sp. GI1]|uniref:DUF2281 domain-containing protein n=1 Tax=Myxosarcina sp. GI1 TaxID=1541065 RepID=UPI0005666D73|nr:DUF2281 domain-containing protein [Myxosarcina sp. GI1]
MTIRKTAISKLQQLPEPLLQQVSDFIDFLTHKHQQSAVTSERQNNFSETWTQWFESVDCLQVKPAKSVRATSFE